MFTALHPSIEKAWTAYQALVVQPSATEQQIADQRLAFYAGAATLFHGIMRGLSPGEEPSPDDMKMMDMIADEISLFEVTFDGEVLKRHGGRQ